MNNKKEMNIDIDYLYNTYVDEYCDNRMTILSKEAFIETIESIIENLIITQKF